MEGESTGPDAIFANGFEGEPVVPACTPQQLLADPGLEATSIDGNGLGTNPFWGSTSSNFGTVFCNSDQGGNCPTDGGTAVPRNGQFFAWFGGIAAAETSTLTQAVTIPAGDPRHLNCFSFVSPAGCCQAGALFNSRR